MKNIILIIIGVIHSFFAVSQQTIAVSEHKTSTLVFSSPVIHADRGNTSVGLQPVKENNKIILIKALEKGFTETNVTVLTQDGNSYEFTLVYNENPTERIIRVSPMRISSVETYARSLLGNLEGHVAHSRHDGMCFLLQRIHVKDRILYFTLLIKNCSSLEYQKDRLQFVIRDKVRARRTAVQETELNPVYTAGNSEKIAAHSFTRFVIAIDQFTIPDSKDCLISLTEKNGGRRFQLKIRGKDIMRATQLPDLD